MAFCAYLLYESMEGGMVRVLYEQPLQGGAKRFKPYFGYSFGFVQKCDLFEDVPYNGFVFGEICFDNRKVFPEIRYTESISGLVEARESFEASYSMFWIVVVMKILLDVKQKYINIGILITGK